MLYREAGQFKTNYAADMAIFPIRQDRLTLGLLLAGCLHRRAAAELFSHLAVRPGLSPARDPAAVPDPVAGGDRREHSGRLLRTDFARQRRLHGDRRLLGLQARHRRAHSARLARIRYLDPGAAGAAVDPARRLHVGALSASCSAFRACASRAFILRWRRWPRSSSSTGCSCACRGSPTTRRPAR